MASLLSYQAAGAGAEWWQPRRASARSSALHQAAGAGAEWQSQRTSARSAASWRHHKRACLAARARARDFDWGRRGPDFTPTGNCTSNCSLTSLDLEGPWLSCVGEGSGVCDESEVLFKVYFQSHPGELLKLSGNHPSFGGWDLEKALPLRWTPNHMWQSDNVICVAPGTMLEYKYVLFREGEEDPVWQGGKNQVVHIPEDSEGCRFVVEDSWDTARHDHHVEKHDEHSMPQPIPSECFHCAQCLMPHLRWRTCPILAAQLAGGAASPPPAAAAAM